MSLISFLDWISERSCFCHGMVPHVRYWPIHIWKLHRIVRRIQWSYSQASRGPIIVLKNHKISVIGAQYCARLQPPRYNPYDFAPCCRPLAYWLCRLAGWLLLCWLLAAGRDTFSFAGSSFLLFFFFLNELENYYYKIVI